MVGNSVKCPPKLNINRCMNKVEEHWFGPILIEAWMELLSEDKKMVEPIETATQSTVHWHNISPKSPSQTTTKNITTKVKSILISYLIYIQTHHNYVGQVDRATFLPSFKTRALPLLFYACLSNWLCKRNQTMLSRTSDYQRKLPYVVSEVHIVDMLPIRAINSMVN